MLSHFLHRPLAVRTFQSTAVRKFGKLIDILETEEGTRKTTVNEFDKDGIRINDTLVRHPVLLLPEHFLMWNTYKYEDIDVDSLSLFSFVYPTIECVFVGGGVEPPERLPLEVRDYFRLRGIVVESMDSMNAVQTFNVMMSEGRNVGAAVLPLYPFPESQKNAFDLHEEFNT